MRVADEGIFRHLTIDKKTGTGAQEPVKRVFCAGPCVGGECNLVKGYVARKKGRTSFGVK